MNCGYQCDAQVQIQQLLARVAELEKDNAIKQAQITWYEEQVKLANQRRFGHSKDSKPEQLALFHFNEAEQLADASAREPVLKAEDNSASQAVPRKRRSRKALWENLPEVEVRHTLTDTERICPRCNTKRRKMSEEVRYELGVIPARFFVKKETREVFVCEACNDEGDVPAIVTAEAPKPPIAGSMASPSLLAYIMDLKYTMGMPLYRTEQMLKRMGLGLSRQNLANWVINGSELWLDPLYSELHRELLTRHILHSDESSLQVLREAGRAATTKSSMWLYCTGREEADRSICLFKYQQTKAARWPAEFLKGFRGYLHVDGAASYEAAGLHDVFLAACWSHARRPYVEALKIAPRGADLSGTHAAIGLAYCDRLFELEREFDKAGLTPEERYRARQEHSAPVLEAYRTWLGSERDKVIPKSATGKAMEYSRNQWHKLVCFLRDGRLEITNNRAERAIKSFVMGRKAWLFSNTPRGADASAVIYSIIETAKANGLKPFDYLQWLFEVMPNMRLTSDNLRSLFPWSDAVPTECRLLTPDH